MLINQLSIFIENEKGRLAEIMHVLKDNNIDIRALSLADTTDFGILRLIVNKPDLAQQALKESGHTVSITKVIAIGVADTPGGLSAVLDILSDEGLNLEYMYAFIGRETDTAFVIIRVDDNAATESALSKHGVKMLGADDIYNY